MATFKRPVCSKKTNATGQQELSYLFEIENRVEGIEFIAETPNDISVESIQHCIQENQEWWHEFLETFLKQSAKFFSKQYTVQNLLKVIRHVLAHKTDSDMPIRVILVPKHIEIVGGIFMVHWTYTYLPIVIDIPGLSDPLPDSNKLHGVNEVTDGVAELNMDELPMDSTGESVELEDPNRMYQKQKVKEAILKAKVAYLKAQNQIRTFSDKYGDDYSSEFELDTENDSEDEDEEDDS